MSNNTEENSEQHPKKKWYDQKAGVKSNAFACLVIYMLFIVVDVHEIYLVHRFLGILAGGIATIALLYAEAFATNAIAFIWWVISSGFIIFIYVILYLFLPSTRIPEVEVIGSLQPANDPTPPNGCDRTPIPSDMLKILMGIIYLTPYNF
jgi:uncharacterized membrane-anchored protein YitT (DUF2179 family)